MSGIPCYLAATSPRSGALAIFHAYGDEEDLRRCLDRRIGPKEGIREGRALAPDELRYGWLWSRAGEALDEVMLAKPACSMRVLMSHGGPAVRKAVETHFADMGFPPFAEGGEGELVARTADTLYLPLLAGCLTEAQAAAVLEAREARERGEPVAVPERLLLTHRVLICGPANAGKSSLLNALAGYERAFVDAAAGATRDVVDELVDVGGYAVLLGDLPGFTGGEDGLAAAAWSRAAERLRLAEALWFVLDGSLRWEEGGRDAAREIAKVLAESGRASPEVMVICNKSDLPAAIPDEPWKEFFPQASMVRVCSLPDGDAREKLGEHYALHNAPEPDPP